MEGNFQASFIPKKPLVQTQGAQNHTHVSIFSILSVLVFILSIAAAVGCFLWVRVLQDQVEDNKITLQTTRESFDPRLIDELKRVNTRIDVAKELMQKHLAISNFFDVIESFTLRSVRFKNFNYNFDPENNNIVLSMNGEAESFSAIALQSDVLGKTKALTNPILSNLALDEKGRVTFTLNATVAPSLLLYKDFVQGAAPAAATSTEPAGATPNATQ
jgi:hypothetical protein